MAWFSVAFGPSYTGLATVGYRQVQANGTTVVARTTTGVVEIAQGAYGVVVTPNVLTTLIEWDTGGGSPIYAHEDVLFGANVVQVNGTAQTAGDLAALLATLTTYVDTEVAAIKAKTDNLPSDPADASDIAASFSSIASSLATIATYIDTEVAAIKAKTDNLPADPADASDIAASFATVNATLATLSGFIDTEIAAILAAVDTEVAAIKAKTDNLPATPAAAGDAMALTSAAVDAILDDAADGAYTVRQLLRGFAAALLSKASGLETTTAVFRDSNDTKNRITATVDADGNRSAVTLDLT